MPREVIDPGYFSPDVRDCLRLLHAHGVKYLVVGGEAVIFYGHARLTGDIDIFYEFSPDNVQRLYDALLAFWEGDIPGIGAIDDFETGVILQFGVPPHRLDLINQIDGVMFDEAWPARTIVTMEADGEIIEVNYVGLEALIRNKEASGRPKDLDDLAFLRPNQP